MAETFPSTSQDRDCETSKPMKRRQKKIVGPRQMRRRLMNTAAANNNPVLGKIDNLVSSIDCELYSQSTDIDSDSELRDTNVSNVDKVLTHPECFNLNSDFSNVDVNLSQPDVCSNSDFEVNQLDVASQSNGNLSLSKQLTHWAISGRVSHSNLTSLLHILHEHHPYLPLDSRTLLKTPSHVDVIPLESGEFVYFGIEYYLKYFVNRHSYNEKAIHLSFNIDGLPIFHSKNLQLWPILGKVVADLNTRPFAIGIYCGNSKPSSLELYLRGFVSELSDLLNNGFHFSNKIYEVEVFCIVCDAPARAFIKCIKTHTGYSCCERCHEPGESISNRMILKGTPKRTDKSFRLQTDEEHHVGISPLVSLPIDLIMKFPIDYMHNGCLGVMRKLLNYWVGGPLKTRLSGNKVKELSNHLEALKDFIPREFNRKTRSLTELSRWKATEFRTFLLYVGPLVLKDVVDLAVYEHFMLLHCGFSVLLSKKHISNLGLQLAKTCLDTFIKHSENLYGLEFLVYNVHNLTHLADDASIYGPLDNVSCFPFENYLGKLKSLIKSSTKPLQQICRRLSEIQLSLDGLDSAASTFTGPKFPHHVGPLLDSMSDLHYNQFKQFYFDEFVLSISSYSEADSYCFLTDGLLIQIHNIIINNASSEIIIIGKQFLDYKPFYHYPCESSKFDIYIVSYLLLSAEFKSFYLKSVVAKCIMLPYKNNYCVSLPIIHSTSSFIAAAV